MNPRLLPATLALCALSAALGLSGSALAANVTLTVTRSGTGSGTVTSNPAGINCGATCSASFASGTTVTLTATPAAHNAFAGWSGACTGTGPCSVSLSAAKTVGATFRVFGTETYEYDANGNPTRHKDALGQLRTTSYDALGRAVQLLEPDPAKTGYTLGQIAITYDGQDQTASVVDPRKLTTTYTIDGLGKLGTLASPDSGQTTYTYDAAGNLKTRTDARGKQTLYGYDALNRLTQVNPGDQLITLTWDSCSNGLGRLCQIIDGTANTLYQYDRAGHVTGKTVTIGSVSLVTAYAWNSSGQLTGITTPSGQSIAYAWANGRVSGVAVNGSPLIAALQYQPFGPIKRWTWGNGEVMSRSYDYAGQLRRYSLGTDPKNGLADHRTLSYDAAGRLLRSVPAYDAQWDLAYTYDGLDRLVQARLADPVTTTWAYAYDVSGNRTRHTENGSTTNYALAATSHRLTALSGAESRSFTYDATGNVTAEGPGMVHLYDASGRRVKTTVGGQVWAYAYSALGERLKKSGSSTTLYAYDEDHHLLGEYSATGKLIQETVWLGEMPVATLRLPASATSGPASVFYVHADHLNTPRRVTRPADHKVLWQWQGEPFGNTLANENPQGAGVFRYALRFPGQVFDPESGLSYNFFRDYDSNTGRYRESDPIGLAGGSWSTYGYVNGNPLSYTDPTGEAATLTWCFGGPIACAAGVTAAAGSLVWAQTQMSNAGRGSAASSSSADQCEDDEKPDCRKASRWDLQQAGIFDEHAYKREHGAVPESRYDICKCKDGSIRIAAVGTCGKTSDFWD